MYHSGIGSETCQRLVCGSGSANAVGPTLPDDDNFAGKLFGNRTNGGFVSNECAVLFRTANNGQSGTRVVISSINPRVASSAKPAPLDGACLTVFVAAFLLSLLARRVPPHNSSSAASKRRCFAATSI